MAIWQCSFTIIPKESIVNNPLNIQHDKDGLFEDDIYWSITSSKIDIFSNIESFIPKGNSWSDEIILFGSEDSTCLEVYKDENHVKSVSFRIDFTRNYECFLKGIIEFTILKDLIIMDEDYNILIPDFYVLKKSIENSQQFLKYIQLCSKSGNIGSVT